MMCRVIASLQDVVVWIRDELKEIKADIPEEWLETADGKIALKNAVKAGVKVFVQEWKKCMVDTNNVLELIGMIVVPATVSKFVAKEKFVRGTGHKAKVKISYLGDNFTSWFLNGDGKTEDLISEQTLRYHKLRQSSVDGPIIPELGGAEKSETTLSEMFSLMEKQKNGESGPLLNNGRWNIFYIRDQSGVLRTVSVDWDDGGWFVDAYPVENPYEWYCGCQVFSRKSVLKSSEPSAPAA